jgi:transcriptional regulator GlxA family with amidase domain
MDPRVRKVISLMARNLHRDFNLDEIAQTMNLSASRLRHIFKKEIGLSPRQYLKAQRIERARQLLETTYFNVKEIMLRVGIRDQSHFARAFKRVNGLSPAQYRKRHLAQTASKEIEADSQISQITAKMTNK